MQVYSDDLGNGFLQASKICGNFLLDKQDRTSVIKSNSAFKLNLAMQNGQF